MKNNSIKISSRVIAVALSFLVPIFLTTTVNAQQPTSETTIEVSPPVSYFHAPPGTTQTHVITIQNLSTKMVTVSPKVFDFAVNPSTNAVVPLESLSFPFLDTEAIGRELEIPAGKRAQLSLKMTIPSDAAEREYPLTIIFFTKENNLYSNAGSISKINAAVASNLIVLVAKQNNQKKLLKVAQIQTKTFFDSFSQLSFTPIIENDNFAAHQISGTVQVLNWKKEVVEEFELYPDTVLGNNKRKARAINTETTEPEEISLQKRFLVGPLQIKVSLTDAELAIDTYTIIVYAFPLSLFACIAVVAMTGVAIYLQKYKKLVLHR